MSLKVRKNLSPPPPEDCPLLECMSVLGRSWAPSVIWYLSGGPRRFNELRVDIPPISAKVLSTRLRELEAEGIVLRQVQPTSPPSVEYSLTETGRMLVPAIEAIANVGTKLKKNRRKRAKAQPEAISAAASG